MQLSRNGNLVLFLPWPIGAMPLHVQRTYYIVHTLALAKLTCAVLYSTHQTLALALALAKLMSTRVACEVAWYLWPRYVFCACSVLLYFCLLSFLIIACIFYTCAMAKKTVQLEVGEAGGREYSNARCSNSV